jgi:hypothetical protein
MFDKEVMLLISLLFTVFPKVTQIMYHLKLGEKKIQLAESILQHHSIILMYMPLLDVKE